MREDGTVERLLKGQEARWAKETKERSSRLRKGIKGFVDFISGRAAAIRRLNEQEAFQSYVRDRGQRESLYGVQRLELSGLDKRIDTMRSQHRQERMQLARRIAAAWKFEREGCEHAPSRIRDMVGHAGDQKSPLNNALAQIKFTLMMFGEEPEEIIKEFVGDAKSRDDAVLVAETFARAASKSIPLAVLKMAIPQSAINHRVRQSLRRRKCPMLADLCCKISPSEYRM